MILYLIITQFTVRIHFSVELTDTLQDKMYLTYILNLMRSIRIDIFISKSHFSSNAASQSHIFVHNCNSLCMYGT